MTDPDLPKHLSKLSWDKVDKTGLVLVSFNDDEPATGYMLNDHIVLKIGIHSKRVVGFEILPTRCSSCGSLESLGG